jgi:hypothetical protein
MTHLPRLLALALVLAPATLGACDDNGARTDATVLPKGADFRPVALVFGDRCGSLDCHGSKYRNMHIVGFGGARLDPGATPDAPDTTDAEVAYDYDAVVSVEPDITRAVAADHGADPERLTFYRKGRGDEAHKGGQRIFPGDAADKCILSWLAGAVDAKSCHDGVQRFSNP